VIWLCATWRLVFGGGKMGQHHFRLVAKRPLVSLVVAKHFLASDLFFVDGGRSYFWEAKHGQLHKWLKFLTLGQFFLGSTVATSLFFR